MLLISGLNFGFRRSIPHIFGITFGFPFMVVIVGLGLGEIFEKYPLLYSILRYACAAYLIYLAWKIARFNQKEVNAEVEKPISFLQAAVFQWANPKAWVMAVVAVTTYTPKENFFTNIGIIAIIFIVILVFTGGIWTAFGNWFRRFLHKPHYLSLFNKAMALLLVLSLYPLLQS